MGCLQEKPKPQRTQNHLAPAAPSRPSHHPPHNDGTPTRQEAGEGWAEGVQKAAEGVVASWAGGSGSGREQSSRQVAERYSIAVKESSYKTPSIHSYNYQPLIQFNPTQPSSESTEQEVLDRTYGGLRIPTLTDIHNRLLFSKH